jgi:peptide/nickel transport system substrate-binding protein
MAFSAALSAGERVADALRCRTVRRLSILPTFVAVLVAGMPAAPAVAQETVPVVRVPFPAYDGTLTPYTFGIGYPLVTLVYDTLMWRDDAGIPRPWLARSVKRSDNGRRLTLTLAEGVNWHDGRPLTAADVAFTFRFAASRYHPRFTPSLSNVRRISTEGTRTVRIDLRRRSIGFDDQPLADLPILPRHLWQGLPAGRTAPRGLPVGTGPYRLVQADRKDGYVFRANTDFFLDEPRVREIRVPIIGDADETYKALKDRRLDMVPLVLPRRSAEDLDAGLGISLRRGPSFTGTSLVLNLRRAPFDRREVRQAVAASLNLQRLVRNVSPAESAIRGFVHPASDWAGGARVQAYNAEQAATLANALGERELPVLAPVNDPVRIEAGRQVVLALGRAGARAKLVKVSRARLDRALGATGQPPDFDAAIETIPALVSHDPDYLTRLFGSDRNGGAPLNASGYRSAAFDRAAARVLSAPTKRERRLATQEELRLLARDVPAIPLFFSRGVFANRPSIYPGWVFVEGTGILDKRSFLPGGDTIGDPGAVTGTISADEGGFTDVLNIISLVALALVVVAAAVAFLRRRPRER